MNESEMKDFVSSRIEILERKVLNANLQNENGILIHFIPENLINNKPINWAGNKQDQFSIKYEFRRFSDTTTIYEDKGDGILGYTPNRELFFCFQDGIIETFKGPLEINSILLPGTKYVKVDHIFYQVRDTLLACIALHKKIFNSIPPFYIYITLIGVESAYFYSLDKKYYMPEPFPAVNGRFEPFVLNDLNDNIMPEIISGVHYGVRSIRWLQ